VVLHFPLRQGRFRPLLKGQENCLAASNSCGQSWLSARDWAWESQRSGRAKFHPRSGAMLRSHPPRLIRG